MSSFQAGSRETLYWAAKPAHRTFIVQYLLYSLGLVISLIFIPDYLLIAIGASLFFSFKIFSIYWETKTTEFFLSHERLRIVKGSLRGRRTFDVERHRLMDVELHEPFLHQILGVGIIEIRNLQWDKENVKLNGVEKPRIVREIIRGVATGSRNVKTYLAIDLSELDTSEQQKLLG